MKKIVVGLAVAGIFIYLSVRGVDFHQVGASLVHVSPLYLLLALLQYAVIAAVRSMRWGVLLRSLVRVSHCRLFPLFSVGFMAVVILPARLGELVRPYALRSQVEVPYAPVLGTILLERIFDAATVLVIMGALALAPGSPPWLLRSSYGALVFLAVLFAAILALHHRPGETLHVVKRLFSKVSPRLGDALEGALRDLSQGLRIVSMPLRLVQVAGLSIVVWGLSVSAIYTLFQFQGLNLPMAAALTVLVTTVIGVSLPTAPGMVGNIHYACMVALSLFAVTKEQALAFSMIFYLAGVGMTILLGFLCLPFVRINYKEELRRIFSRESER